MVVDLMILTNDFITYSYIIIFFGDVVKFIFGVDFSRGLRRLFEESHSPPLEKGCEPTANPLNQ